MGASLQAQGKESLSALQKAVEFSPGDSNAHINPGNAWQSVGDYENAQISHQHALALNPMDAVAHCNLGNALKAQGKNEVALAVYLQALSINPQLAQVHQNVGAIFLDAKMYKEAILAANNAISLNPDFAEAYDCLALAMAEIGNVRDAVDEFERALTINSKFLDGHYHRAFMVLYAGDKSTAISEFIWVITNGTGNLTLEAAVYAAILLYIAGDLQSCKDLLKLSETILHQEVNYKNACVYWRYPALLISEYTRTAARSLPVIHVIGDSHSLSAAHATINYKGVSHRSETEWIVGCKAWHLGNAQANRYKSQFKAALARISPNSTVLLMFGEIDC